MLLARADGINWEWRSAGARSARPDVARRAEDAREKTQKEGKQLPTRGWDQMSAWPSGMPVWTGVGGLCDRTGVRVAGCG